MYKQSLKLQTLLCFRMLVTGCNKEVKIHPWLAQDVTKHVKRSSSYDSLRNGWRFARLKSCWLERISLLPCWPARTGNWLLFCQKARYILVVFLLSYWGGGGEREIKKEKFYMSFFLLCSREIPWSSCQNKESELTFIWPYQKGTPLSCFILPL